MASCAAATAATSAHGSARARDPTRRRLLGAVAAGSVWALAGRARATEPLRFGLTPVFLSDDLALRTALGEYLEAATRTPVDLVTRRTYQEITALLVSGRLDAAWICGYPFVTFRDRLDLVATPIWRGSATYRSEIIVAADRPAGSVLDLAGDIHAFSDPDSNSGYLVTAALLVSLGLDPARFFARAIFTYGHRNVVRAVASGLCASGSVDGYVLEVMREVEPALAASVRVLRASEPLGFPPICAPSASRGSERAAALERALLEAHLDPAGQGLLGMLRLDRFAKRDASLYGAIADKVALLERAT